MSKYTFTCEHWDGGKVTVEKEIETLNDVLETFEFFLKGSGFYFKGQIDVVPFDDESGDTVSLYDNEEDEVLFDFGAGQPVYSTDGSVYDGHHHDIEINLSDAQAAMFPDISTKDTTIVIK